MKAIVNGADWKGNDGLCYFAMMGMTNRAIFVLLLAAVLAVYANSFHSPFIFDDIHTIVENEGLRDITDLKQVFTSEYAGRPILFLSFAVNYLAGGLDTFGYHAVNLLLHLFSSILVFLILDELLCRNGVEDKRYAAFGAGLFALHPMAVETVTYLSSRSDGLSTLLYLLALLLLIRSGISLNRYFLASYVSIVLGLFTKETAITFPALATVFMLQFEPKEKRREQVCALVLLWLLVPIYFAYRVFALGTALEPVVGETITPHDYFLTQLAIVPFQYLTRLFVPVNQILDADLMVRESVWDPAVLGGVAVVGGLLAFAFARFHKQKVHSFSVLWFFGALSITSSIYPIYDTYAERRVYIALPAFCLAVSYALYLLVSKGGQRAAKVAASAAVAVLVLFGVLTWNRNQLFTSAVAVMEDSVGKTMNNPRMYTGLFDEYLKMGDVGKAEESALFAVRKFPSSPMVQLDYCWVLGFKGDFAKMGEVLATVKPKYPVEAAWYYNFRGVLEGQKGNYEAAMQNFHAALAAMPGHVEARANVAVLLKAMGKRQEAVAYLRQAVIEKPLVPDFHYQLGILLMEENREAAATEFREALRLQPTHGGARQALQRLGGMPAG